MGVNDRMDTGDPHRAGGHLPVPRSSHDEGRILCGSEPRCLSVTLVSSNRQYSRMNRAVGRPDGTVALAGGRRLGYRLRDHGGPVFVYLHGSPGSRAESDFFADWELDAAGVSMLAIERPGYGMRRGSDG